MSKDISSILSVLFNLGLLFLGMYFIAIFVRWIGKLTNPDLKTKKSKNKNKEN